MGSERTGSESTGSEPNDGWSAATSSMLARHLGHLRSQIEMTPPVPTEAGASLRRLHDRHRLVLLATITGLVKDLRSTTGVDEARQLSVAVRAMYGLVAGFQGCAEWHSPPRYATMACDRGTGTPITDHDYRRDRCPVVAEFEARWLAEHERADRHAAPRPLAALAFTSGMAAIATIAAMLSIPNRSNGPRFLLSDSIYHETALLFAVGDKKNQVEWFRVDEATTLIRLLAGAGPHPVVMVDGQSNGPGLDVADVGHLMGTVSRHSPSATIVIDATTTPLGCRPFRHLTSTGNRLIVVESLTKFAQWGQDRVAGGIVVTDSQTAGQLDQWREHMGTIAVAPVIRQLPPPSADVVDDRMTRHGNNARRLAAQLGRITSGTGLQVVDPQGGSLVVLRGWPANMLGDLVAATVAGAATNDVPLAHGTSFGFDTTRISLITARSPAPDRRPTPFVRIAVGCGPASEIDALADVMAATIAECGRRFLAEPSPLVPGPGAEAHHVGV